MQLEADVTVLFLKLFDLKRHVTTTAFVVFFREKLVSGHEYRKSDTH